MGEAGGATVLRFRHTLGDIGPLEFGSSSSIKAVKESLFRQWPADGPLSKETPSAWEELRLLCSGQFLEDGKTLKDYHKLMGSPEELAVVTMHVLVRPPQAANAADKADPDAKPAKSGCSCVIC